MTQPESQNLLYNDWLNLNLHLFWCYDGKIGQGQATTGTSISHTDYSNSGAWLIRKGWARVEYDNEIHTAGPGQWLIVKPCQRKQTFAADSEGLSISFDARWPDGSHLFDEGLCTVVEADDYPALEKKAKPIVKAVKQIAPLTWDARACQTDLAGFMKMQSVLCEWMTELGDVLRTNNVQHSGQVGVDERVMQAVRLINSHELGEPLVIEDLGASIGLSANHLVRLFQKDLQQTPIHYFEKMRLEHAVSRLKLQDVRIKEVAVELGFTYLSHFSKWFKKQTGKSPRDFKKK